MRKAAFLVFAMLLFVACAPAQSDDSVAGAAAAKAPSPSKVHRVWDNDSIQQIQGDINVVGEESTPKPATPGKPKQLPPVAPGVAFKATTIDGNVISSDSLYGRPVLIQYWATWCPHCRADQAAVDRIAQAGVPVLAVNVGESEAKVRNYLKVSPRACAIILEKDSNLDRLVDVQGFPTYVVLDPLGHIVGQKKGEAGDAGLRSLVGRALANTNSSQLR